jgi:hypothetical protein
VVKIDSPALSPSWITTLISLVRTSASSKGK